MPESTTFHVPACDGVVLTEPERSGEFAGRMPAGCSEVRWYDELFHEISHESPADRARVLDDLQTWLKSHVSPLETVAAG
jgi:alpha-beta hydrolase superfamily lysophospholipase